MAARCRPPVREEFYGKNDVTNGRLLSQATRSHVPAYRPTFRRTDAPSMGRGGHCRLCHFTFGVGGDCPFGPHPSVGGAFSRWTHHSRASLLRSILAGG